MSLIGNTSLAYRESWAAAGGDREDLSDVLSVISPIETPLLASLPTSPTDALNPEWMADYISAPGDPDGDGVDGDYENDASVEADLDGVDATFSDPQARTKLNNTIHKIDKTGMVTGQRRAIANAGITDELVFETERQLIQLAQAIEFALIHSRYNATQGGPGNQASPAVTAASMEGLIAWIRLAGGCATGGGTAYRPAGRSADLPSLLRSQDTDVSASPHARLTETIFNNHVQNMLVRGEVPDLILVPAVQKREISSWAVETRNIESSKKAAIRPIDVYTSDFGTHIVEYHRMIPKRNVLTLKTGYLGLKVLVPAHMFDLGKVGDMDAFMITTSLTLMVLNPAALGRIHNLSNTYGSVA